MPQHSSRSLLLLTACAAFAQTVPKVEFEVVSIKAAPPPDGRGMTVGCKGGPGSPDPELLRCQNNSLRDLITRGFGMEYFQVSGPDWLATTRFDFNAKIPPGATKEQLQMMIRNMLIDRFKIEVRHESREMAKYDLVVAKSGAKLKETVEDPTKKDDASRPFGPAGRDKDGYPVLAPGRPGMAMMSGKARLFYPNWTMEMLAGQLTGQLSKPVTDATGLKGKYDIALYWSVKSVRVAPPPPAGENAAPIPEPDADSGPTLEQAIQDQLGLRLEAKKGPVDFLIVERIEKLPTDN